MRASNQLGGKNLYQAELFNQDCHPASPARRAVALLANINPFLPTGQFMAPKLNILIKCLIDFFFKVLF